MKKNLLLILTTIVFSISILGCNMLKGAGQDIEDTGGNIKETVEKND